MSEQTRGPGRPRKAETELKAGGRRRDTSNIGRARSRMTAPQIKGYKTRWTNDEGAKLHEAYGKDWEFVLYGENKDIDGMFVGDADVNNTTQPGEKISISVGRVKDKSNCKAFLMKKKEAWFKKDNQLLQDQITEREKGLLRTNKELNRGSVTIN